MLGLIGDQTAGTRAAAGPQPSGLSLAIIGWRACDLYGDWGLCLGPASLAGVVGRSELRRTGRRDVSSEVASRRVPPAIAEKLAEPLAEPWCSGVLVSEVWRTRRAAHDGLSRPPCRGSFRVREAEFCANGGEAQELTTDAYYVVDAAGSVAVPAHEFRFFTAEGIGASHSFLHVRAPHVRLLNNHRNAHGNGRSIGPRDRVVASFRRPFAHGTVSPSSQGLCRLAREAYAPVKRSRTVQLVRFGSLGGQPVSPLGRGTCPQKACRGVRSEGPDSASRPSRFLGRKACPIPVLSLWYEDRAGSPPTAVRRIWLLQP